MGVPEMPPLRPEEKQALERDYRIRSSADLHGHPTKNGDPILPAGVDQFLGRDEEALLCIFRGALIHIAYLGFNIARRRFAPASFTDIL